MITLKSMIVKNKPFVEFVWSDGKRNSLYLPDDTEKQQVVAVLKNMVAVLERKENKNEIGNYTI